MLFYYRVSVLCFVVRDLRGERVDLGLRLLLGQGLRAIIRLIIILRIMTKIIIIIIITIMITIIIIVLMIIIIIIMLLLIITILLLILLKMNINSFLSLLC